MPQTFPASTGNAILGFHLADRLKSELIVASRLLTSLMQMQGEQEEGARQLFMEYLKALLQDVTLCESIISEQEMIRVRTVFHGLIGLVAEGQLADVQNNLTWILTIMTTYAQRGMQYLYKENLLTPSPGAGG